MTLEVGLYCEPNKALACKCITGKILMPENGVFENELNNYPNDEILNDKLLPEILLLRAGQ